MATESVHQTRCKVSFNFILSRSLPSLYDVTKTVPLSELLYNEEKTNNSHVMSRHRLKSYELSYLFMKHLL
jgi:hypothetical protein